jgi:hypothetical protein
MLELFSSWVECRVHYEYKPAEQARLRGSGLKQQGPSPYSVQVSPGKTSLLRASCRSPSRPARP